MQFTIDSLTPSQRARLDAMPIGEWIEPNGSVVYAMLERMGLIERRSEYIGKSYGRVLVTRYRRV